MAVSARSARNVWFTSRLRFPLARRVLVMAAALLVAWALAIPPEGAAVASAAPPDPGKPKRAAAASTPPAGGEYVPLQPARIVDTRSGQGGTKAPLGEAESRSFTVLGVGGVPTSGVSAVVLSVTATDASDNSWLAVWPSGEARPTVSQLSITAGHMEANTVIAKVGAGGQIDVYNRWGQLNVVLDVQGYFTDNTVTTAGGTFVAVSPRRIYDTNNSGQTPLVGGETRDIQVTGLGGVPSSGVSAVAVNLTVVDPTTNTSLQAFPAGTTRPGVSTLQASTGQIASALAQVKVGTSGKISVWANSGQMRIFIDVEGYYLDNTQDGRDLYVPISPRRIYTSTKDLAAREVRAIQVAGAKDSSGNVVVPASGVTSVAVSITAVQPKARGIMTAWAAGEPQPAAQAVSYNLADNNVTGTAILAVGSGGRINVYSSAASGLLIDVQGYYQAMPPKAPPAPAVSSSTHPKNAWTATANASFTFSSTSTAVTRFVYATDDESFAEAESVATTNGAAKTVTVTPGGGWHTLYVRAVDFANNLSPVASYQFGTTPGVTSPEAAGRTQRFMRLAAQAGNGFTGVKWQYRQGESAAWRDIPADHVTKGGQPAPSWPVAVTTGAGASADVPELEWNMPRTIYGVEGTAQVRACFSKSGSADVCTTDTVTATMDKADVAGSTEDMGPGSVSLLSGNMSISETDASVASYGSDLTVARTFNTLKPAQTPAGAPQMLDANQAQVEEGTTGFVTRAATVAATWPAYSGSNSLKITPSGTSDTDMDTHAAIGGNTGALRLGMKPGRTYNFTTQIYVPAVTGIETASYPRALRAILYYRVGTGSYVEVRSNTPNATDTWQELRLRATLPAGTTEAFIRLYNGRPSTASNKPVYYDNNSLVEEGMFGPGWTGSLPVDEAGADWTGLTDQGASVVVTDSEGVATTFAKKTDGTYTPTGEDAPSGLTLTPTGGGAGGPAEFKVADLDANATVFTPATTYTSGASETAPHTYQVGKVVQPGSNQNTTYTYNADGRISQMLAPLPPGVASCTTWVAGCKALTFTYNPAGHVTAVTFRTTTATGTELKVDVACYAYDEGSAGDGVGGTGQLLKTWDPRTVSGAGGGTQPVKCDAASPVLPTTYTYDSQGRVTTEKPAGLAAWVVAYDVYGRVTSVKRTHNAGNGGGTETTTVEYDVPRAADGANPEWRPDLSTAGKVAKWGQKEVPVTATAVFGPGKAASRTDLRKASLTYLNTDGRTINTASYAGTGPGAGGWALTTVDYDKWGNVVRELSAANRAEVLAAEGLPDWKGIAAPDPGARMLMVSTINIYTKDGKDLLDTFGPYREVTLPDGRVVMARAHTHNDYDTGTELGHPAGPTLHLVTSTYTAASLSSAAVATDEQDKRTTKNEYALSTTDATGWTYSKPMKVTSDPSGIASVTTTRYDADSGLVIESRMPSEPNGGGPGTTETVYYTAGANSKDAACGNKPAWANLTCLTRPANLNPGTAGLPQLVVERVKEYDYLNRTTITEETVIDAGGTSRTRTSTTTYDNGGYSTRVKTSQLTGGVGTAVPATTTSYDPDTGLTSQVVSGTAQQTSSYDDFGRVTSYTDSAEASGDAKNTVTTSYDSSGRVATVTDAKGTVTNTYNENGDNRDLVTSITVSGITGKFAGAYDPDGRLLEQTWPNGLIQTFTFDSASEQTSRRQMLEATWLEETIRPNVHGQWRTQVSTGANVNREQTYTYDNLGRLTWTRDNGSGRCLHRNYRFDANSNRTLRNVYGPASDGTCQAIAVESATSYTYDTADRLKPEGTHTGTVYDAYGRVTTLPAADTTSGSGNVTIGYYTNDLVRSMAQDGATLTYTLDAAGRLGAFSNSKTGVTKTNHYNDASSDSPDWISETSDHAQWTRNITDLAGTLAATVNQAGKLVWQTVNLHGDVTATADNTTGGPPAAADSYATDEFGVPIGTNTPGRYGWLGGKQRSSETLGGLVLMGVRLYNAQLGRFLQTDPVPGGSANAYEYCNADPINCYDLDGKISWKRAWRKFRGGGWRKVAAGAAFGICVVASAGACLGAGAILSVGYFIGDSIEDKSIKSRRAWRTLAGNLAWTALGGAYGRTMGGSWGRSAIHRIKWKARVGRHSSKAKHSLGRVRRYSKVNWRWTGRDMGYNAVGSYAIGGWSNWR